MADQYFMPTPQTEPRPAPARFAPMMTEWAEFRMIDPAALREAMRGRVVVDLRNIFDPATMATAGIIYHGIGRKPRAATNGFDQSSQMVHVERIYA